MLYFKKCRKGDTLRNYSFRTDYRQKYHKLTTFVYNLVNGIEISSA